MKIERSEKIISEIIWKREDIETLLHENGRDCSEQSVNEFLKNFNMKLFEERCIQLGWELLQSGLEH